MLWDANHIPYLCIHIHMHPIPINPHLISIIWPLSFTFSPKIEPIGKLPRPAFPLLPIPTSPPSIGWSKSALPFQRVLRCLSPIQTRLNFELQKKYDGVVWCSRLNQAQTYWSHWSLNEPWDPWVASVFERNGLSSAEGSPSMSDWSLGPPQIQYLVGGWATPLKNMNSSIGMMKFPIYGKKHVPNHQPDWDALKSWLINSIIIKIAIESGGWTWFKQQRLSCRFGSITITNITKATLNKREYGFFSQ